MFADSEARMSDQLAKNFDDEILRDGVDRRELESYYSNWAPTVSGIGGRFEARGQRVKHVLSTGGGRDEIQESPVHFLVQKYYRALSSRTPS